TSDVVPGWRTTPRVEFRTHLRVFGVTEAVTHERVDNRVVAPAAAPGVSIHPSIRARRHRRAPVQGAMRDSGSTNLQVGLPGGAKERRDLVPARCVPRGQRPWTRGDRHSESARRRLGSVGPSSRSGARRTSSHRAGGAIYLVSQRLVPRAPRRPAGTYPLPIAL